MNEKRAVEKTMQTQAYNGRKPGSPMKPGQAIRASLKARRARTRKPDSPDEAARNSLEEEIAWRDAENALKVPKHSAFLMEALPRRFSELAVFDSRLYIRVRRIEEPA